MRRLPAQPLKTLLLNTSWIELWPADLLRVRSNADARVLAGAHTVLRRKQDGRYLAAVSARAVHPLVPGLPREPGLDEAWDALDQLESTTRGFDTDAQGLLPLHALQERLHGLGLDDTYGERSGLALVAEPAALVFAGRDRYRRPLWLTAAAARAWLAMQRAAYQDSVALEAISGYRSHDYQLGIFERKLARGQTVEQILTVNAAPGYSEHHGGCALDIGTPGEPPAEESFEQTLAFAWLTRRAGDFGFVMSYPRDNPHGIVYEPWHWCYRSAA
ncbi:M15 family metallopeptidase [Pseudoxanthomonas sp. PXM02]|uniref:M15 family metallopeptidase n=1 Tax=Pseudoxanthomonas sp. PXM02 TaxID=2769294 RepID=UPI00177EC00B|nr:M15 family metallopeptidase [Pseudoxanthomonas sp. PXM02]MBD9478052.1 D-alanyl-D-alanine carboxypeptidase family protein [Pseudoxanthomonas sp. PXM02]